jgi:pimeloyl-ACP methyl ester carboxylesterase
LVEISMSTESRLAFAAALSAALLSASPARTQEAALPQDLPRSIYTDPPADAEHPASSLAAQFPSGGATLNAQIYRPAGAGPHPTAILFHGLPGNEQNLDLAQALRRAGWTVVTFHYTGSWGSGGTFTLQNGYADADALRRHLADPEVAKRWGVDPQRTLLVGHSYGGAVASYAARDPRGLLGVALLAPWDFAYEARQWASLSKDKLHAAAEAGFDDVPGRLAGATPDSLAAEIVRDGERLGLTTGAEALAGLPTLVVTAEHDGEDCKAETLLPAMRKASARSLVATQLATDHSFNSHRVALAALLVHGAAALPGAPAGKGAR